MVKSHHVFFLELLDNILNTLNTPTKNYTFTYQELFQIVHSDIQYDKIYQTQFEKFLTEGYDSYTEKTNSTFLLNSALRYLVEGEFVFQFNHISNQYSFQITYKGFLKIHKGFEKSYNDDILKIEQIRNQQKFENIWNVFKPFIGFILGLISAIVAKRYL